MSRQLSAIVTAATSGVIFGIGLAVARMTDPQKIKDFLDIAAIPQGGWDPSLAVVMLAASAVAFFGLRVDRVLRKPLASLAFMPLPSPQIDRPLVIGAAIFGIGWGLSGLCPGPAIADLGVIPSSVALFVIAMFAGSWLAGVLPRSAGGRPAFGVATE